MWVSCGTAFQVQQVGRGAECRWLFSLVLRFGGGEMLVYVGHRWGRRCSKSCLMSACSRRSWLLVSRSRPGGTGLPPWRVARLDIASSSRLRANARRCIIQFCFASTILHAFHLIPSSTFHELMEMQLPAENDQGMSGAASSTPPCSWNAPCRPSSLLRLHSQGQAVDKTMSSSISSTPRPYTQTHRIR